MRKRVFGRRLSRERDTRLALFRSMARSLFINGKMNTTKGKALAVVPFVEKVIRKVVEAKDFSKRKDVFALIANDKKLFDLLFKRINQDFSIKKRFVTVIPLPGRKGDNAEMVRLSLVEGIFVAESKVEVGNKEKKVKKVKSAKKEIAKDKKSKKK
jgi:large subunit ribosomal protein L17